MCHRGRQAAHIVYHFTWTPPSDRSEKKATAPHPRRASVSAEQPSMTTIFFSWQSDTPSVVGRNFVSAVLHDVCKQLAKDTSVTEALRELSVDSDTKDVAGQPPIAETIFKKIDAAGVFVADMTFVGQRSGGDPTPNPNVLIEYGWALKSLGYKRVICVMNDAYGKPSRATLPFDLAHLRWPMCYSLPEGLDAETRKSVKKDLGGKLTAAIRASLGVNDG